MMNKLLNFVLYCSKKKENNVTRSKSKCRLNHWMVNLLGRKRKTVRQLPGDYPMRHYWKLLALDESKNKKGKIRGRWYHRFEQWLHENMASIDHVNDRCPFSERPYEPSLSVCPYHQSSGQHHFSLVVLSFELFPFISKCAIRLRCLSRKTRRSDRDR